MDPRRRLTRSAGLAAAASLSACTHAPEVRPAPPPAAGPAAVEFQTPARVAGSPNGGPIPYAQAWGPALSAGGLPRTPPQETAGRDRSGTAPSPPAEQLKEAMRLLAYAPGRTYAVRAAPLRVTSLSLEPGELLIDKAAGDTVRWQIGETTSGSGADLRTLVLIKPLTAGLATNMVLTTSRRVYLLDLTSASKAFDPAVSWIYPDEQGGADAAAPSAPASRGDAAPAQNQAESRFTAAYAVSPQGRPPPWTPRAVFDDGRRTYIAFPPDLGRSQAPLLFVLDREGRPALANYRLAGDVIIVDRIFEAAELRLGGSRAQVVRIRRQGEAHR